jgi:hypothetical protein
MGEIMALVVSSAVSVAVTVAAVVFWRRAWRETAHRPPRRAGVEDGRAQWVRKS